MALDIPAVLQAQGAEIVIVERSVLVTLQLVAVLRGALGDESAIKFGVLVHSGNSQEWGNCKSTPMNFQRSFSYEDIRNRKNQ